MKRLLSVAATMLIGLAMISTQPTTAKDNECERGYGQDVAECAKQPGSAKACVEAAKERKARCQSGIDACLESCETNYVTRATTCTVNFEREREICNTNSSCQDNAERQWQFCLGAAASEREACLNNCLL